MAHSEGRIRRRVLRADGRTIHVAPKRGHLIVCARGCCCGRDDKGKPAVPVDYYKAEYKRRGIRDRVQLTMSGCIGPCPLLNVALVLFDGKRVWFQSINHPSQIRAIYDYIDRMLAADRFLPPTAELADLAFDYYHWPEDAILAATQADGSRGGAFIDPTSALVDEILLLSHADTDLLSLRRALDDLPEGFPRVRMASLNRVKAEEHLAALVDDGGRVPASWSPASMAGRATSRAGAGWPSTPGSPTSGCCSSTPSARPSPSSSPARPCRRPCSTARPATCKPAACLTSPTSPGSSPTTC